MRKLFDYANRYAGKSTWKEFALVKFCLYAMGVIVGVLIPKKARKPALIVSVILFICTYIPLMTGFFKVVRDEKEG